MQIDKLDRIWTDYRPEKVSLRIFNSCPCYWILKVWEFNLLHSQGLRMQFILLRISIIFHITGRKFSLRVFISLDFQINTICSTFGVKLNDFGKNRFWQLIKFELKKGIYGRWSSSRIQPILILYSFVCKLNCLETDFMPPNCNDGIID